MAILYFKNFSHVYIQLVVASVNVRVASGVCDPTAVPDGRAGRRAGQLCWAFYIWQQACVRGLARGYSFSPLQAHYQVTDSLSTSHNRPAAQGLYVALLDPQRFGRAVGEALNEVLRQFSGLDTKAEHAEVWTTLFDTKCCVVLGVRY